MIKTRFMRHRDFWFCTQNYKTTAKGKVTFVIKVQQY